MNIIKVFNYCWSCRKEHDHTHLPISKHSVKCECGGYVVTPSGKVQSKIIGTGSLNQ